MKDNKDKLPYGTPALERLGAVQRLTQGSGWAGDDDQWWFFTWGHLDDS